MTQIETLSKRMMNVQQSLQGNTLVFMFRVGPRVSEDKTSYGRVGIFLTACVFFFLNKYTSTSAWVFSKRRGIFAL